MKNWLSLAIVLLTLNVDHSFSQTSKKIVLCESYDTYGKPSGINASWNIKSTGGFVYILYDNAGKSIVGSLFLYVDKKGSSGTYSEYATEQFDFKTNAKFAVFDYNFKEPGTYKIQAADKDGVIYATTTATINLIESQTSEDEPEDIYTPKTTNGKSIVLCSDYNKSTGVPSGIYSAWDIKKEGGYVYVIFNNDYKKITGKLWLYVDKKNDAGIYVAYATEVFEPTDKTWAMYDYKFTEPGDYKFSAVSGKGEEATTYSNVTFADGVVVEDNKSIVLCDSYDDYGKPVGISSIWDIKKEGGWVYVLFNNGKENVTSANKLSVSKKNTNGTYVAYDEKAFTGTGKNWSVYDYNFTENGQYKLSAKMNSLTLASVEVTVNYTTDVKTTVPPVENKIEPGYYEKSAVYFAEKVDANGNLTNAGTEFTIPYTGKEIKIVYKDAVPCKTTKLIVDIYGGDNYDEFIETKEIVTTATQKIISFPYTFKTPGFYKFSIYNKDEIYMNLGMVTIKSATTTTTINNNNTIPDNVSSQATDILTVEGPRTALVIGNGDYINAGTLPNPVHDAEAMSKALKSCGFDVTLLVNANKKQMNEAITQFGQKLSTKKGTGMVYYAGHGIQSKGENYLIPTDVELAGEEDLEYDCINVGKILSKMEIAQNNMNVVVLDACRNNPFERSWNRSTNGNGLVGINAPEGTIIAFSTNPGNVASDGSGYNSPYTTAFLNQLKKSGLSIEQVLKGIAAEVKKATPGQLPWYSSSITGDFYFIPK